MFSDSIGKDLAGGSLREMTMGFRILFDEVKLKQGIYQQENDRESEHHGVGWPKAPGSKNVYAKSDNNRERSWQKLTSYMNAPWALLPYGIQMEGIFLA